MELIVEDDYPDSYMSRSHQEFRVLTYLSVDFLTMDQYQSNNFFPQEGEWVHYYNFEWQVLDFRYSMELFIGEIHFSVATSPVNLEDLDV